MNDHALAQREKSSTPGWRKQAEQTERNPIAEDCGG